MCNDEKVCDEIENKTIYKLEEYIGIETLDEEETQNPVIEKEDAEDEEDDEVEDEDPTSDIDDLIESVEDASADVQDALDKNADKITDLLTRIANALEDINKKILD